MTKASTNKKRVIQLVTAIFGALFALITFVTLFLPAFSHQLVGAPNVGLGDFMVKDVIAGGLYDYENDEKDPVTNVLLKYDKLSEGAQYYYQTFILLDDARFGSLFAVCLMLTLVCAVLMFASALVTIGAGGDAFWLQIAISVLHLVFTVGAILLLSPLANLVSNESFPTLNFTVVIGAALIILLVSSVGFIISILLGKILSGEKLFKAKAKK